MAQQALTAGTTQTRRRALFGLLDASGWGWASLKAVFWFILLIFLLGYIPDRAYYFTVNKTIDLGILAWSPVNFCPEGNRTLPCPAPAGAVVPWAASPQLISLPAPRTDGALVQSGTTILYVGGTDGSAPSEKTFVATVAGVGNLDTQGGTQSAWKDGPALPEPRSDAAVIYSGGKIYAIGGLGADGKPTTSVYVLTPDPKTGALGEWQTAKDAKLELDLPEARAGATVVAAADGLLLVGGTNGTAPLNTVLKTTFDPRTGAPGKWAAQPGALYTPVSDASAAIVGSYLWVFGGTGADGKAVATVQRGEFGTGADATKVARFGVAGGGTDLPAPRSNLAGFAANGALYAIGGTDGTTPQSALWWTIPTNNGNITEWKHLDVSDLPASGLAGAAPISIGPDTVLVGGTTKDGVTATSNRANFAPEEPFFQVGLVGATVPALKIDGEIGQQLGYLNANGVGMANFAILIVVGWAFAHKEQIRGWRDRRRRDKEIRDRE